MQKYSHLQNGKLPTELQRPYYTHFLWWGGFWLMVFGTLGDVAALAFAAQSLIAPLAGLTLVFNILITPCFLKEEITTNDMLATVVIIIGNAVAVAFSNHEETVYTFSELVEMSVYQPIFVIYTTLVVCLMACCYLLHNKFKAEEINNTTWFLAWCDYHPGTLAILAGIAGSLSVTFSKGMMELLKAQINGDPVFIDHFFSAPFCLMCLVCTLLMQMHFLNVGLAAFEVMLFFPLYQSAWIIFVALGGIVTYQEYKSFTIYDALLFPLGMVITLRGVYMLMGRQSKYSSMVHPDPELNADTPTSADVSRHMTRSSMGIPTIASSSDSMDNLTVLDVDNDDIGKTPRA